MLHHINGKQWCCVEQFLLKKGGNIWSKLRSLSGCTEGPRCDRSIADWGFTKSAAPKAKCLLWSSKVHNLRYYTCNEQQVKTRSRMTRFVYKSKHSWIQQRAPPSLCPPSKALCSLSQCAFASLTGPEKNWGMYIVLIICKRFLMQLTLAAMSCTL